ncbi:hypothetical protein [Brevibacillus sp. AY1]|uniref:hypothetical protein n=1 Tax=Brevibacillus sp. AY1 TaxID=2807621 RepID=UPI0024584223|nr:hypothetical protein [Brevibacillus sp. AY1]MDH4615637.1 hypothetical protein [Brevibacillus sp. AY1]
MDEDKWLKQLKDRADQGVLRDISFTPELEQKVRNRLRKRSRPVWVRVGSAGVAACLMVFAMWQVWPQSEDQVPSESIISQPPPSLLPGGALETPVLWKPSPVVKSTYDNKPFAYMGEKPVRLITDETSIYEGQQQKFFWLLDGDVASKVEIVAHSRDGQQVELGTYEVMGSQYDAKAHFPSGLVIPDPGIWKLQILSEGKHFGQVFVEVKAGISPSNRSLVEPLIRQWLEAEGKKLNWLGADREISIDLLHVEAPNAEQRRVYAWIRILSKNKELSSGISAPMAFDIQYDGNSYRVKGFEMPEDGNRYQSSLEKIFPAKVLEKLKQRDNKD